MSDPLAADPTLLDKLAIREVLERYMRFNDDRAADRIAELFDENAVVQVVGQLVVGRDAIREFFGGADEQPKPWTEPGELLKQPPSVHLSANPVIDVDGTPPRRSSTSSSSAAARTAEPAPSSSAATATACADATTVVGSSPAVSAFPSPAPATLEPTTSGNK